MALGANGVVIFAVNANKSRIIESPQANTSLRYFMTARV
jgi:hypothetical protein